MARGRHYAKLSLSNAARLSFSDLCILLFLSLSFVCLCFSLLSLELGRCSSDLFLSSRPRTGLATTCILLGMVEARKQQQQQQRETDTANWSTPTFTLPCPKKRRGIYPTTSTFLQNCTPIFRSVTLPDLAGSGTLPSTIFSARITSRSQQRTPKPKSSCCKQVMATGIAFLQAGGLLLPKNTKTSTLPLLNIQCHFFTAWNGL